jgi:hypothetical protein
MINEVDFELAEAQVRAKKMGLRILKKTVEFQSMPFASFHKVTVFSSKRECNALIPAGDDKRMAKFINESCDVLEAVKHG